MTCLGAWRGRLNGLAKPSLVLMALLVFLPGCVSFPPMLAGSLTKAVVQKHERPFVDVTGRTVLVPLEVPGMPQVAVAVWRGMGNTFAVAVIFAVADNDAKAVLGLVFDRRYEPRPMLVMIVWETPEGRWLAVDRSYPAAGDQIPAEPPTLSGRFFLHTRPGGAGV